MQLIRGGGGDFIVIADDKEIWNKKAMGNMFPEEGDIVRAIRTG